MSSVLKSISASINFDIDQNEPDSITEFSEKMDMNLVQNDELESIRILQTKINEVITDKINTLKAAHKLAPEPVDLVSESDGEECDDE